MNDPPAQRTRPKNRRAITIEAASELFFTRGYQQVTVAEIARATNVGSSAIFRHFPTKLELLVATIWNGIDPIVAILEADDAEVPQPEQKLNSLLSELAAFALDNRHVGVLWQRESRGLSQLQQKVIRDKLRYAAQRLAERVHLLRPELEPDEAELIAWCTLGALVSVGFHSAELPRDEYVLLLVKITTALISVDLPAEAPEAPSIPGPHPAIGSRKNDLLTKATELFAESGFTAVSVDDIGAAAGIAGPSIYSHFPSKQKLLLAAVERGNSQLQTELAQALAHDETPAAILDRLVRSYVSLAVHDRFLIRIVLSEIGQLDEADLDYARRQQREYIETWATLLERVSTEDPIASRIRVQAVLLVISDAVQNGHLRTKNPFEQNLRRIALAMLGMTGH